MALPHKPFEICVPLAKNPPLPRPTPPGWLTAREVVTWPQANLPSPHSPCGNTVASYLTFKLQTSTRRPKNQITPGFPHSTVCCRRKTRAQIWQ